MGRKVIWLLAATATMSVLLAGCGDGRGDGGGPAADPTPTSTTSWCREQPEGLPVTLTADLDGDGGPETVTYVPAGRRCPGGPSLVVEGSTGELHVEVADDLPVTRDGLAVVRVPGRKGDLVLLTPHHPRGGFQAHLFGFAGDRLEELTDDGKPVFPFVATDAPSDPLSARCVDGGFEILRARAHQPVGVVPAWDVDRTTYAVEGNEVTRRATTEVADNVLDEQLEKRYGDLVHHRLFANCRVDR